MKSELFITKFANEIKFFRIFKTITRQMAYHILKDK